MSISSNTEEKDMKAKPATETTTTDSQEVYDDSPEAAQKRREKNLETAAKTQTQTQTETKTEK